MTRAARLSSTEHAIWGGSDDMLILRILAAVAAVLMIAGLAWCLMPVLMLATYGSDRQERLGIWRALKLLASHPFPTALAIAIIPLMLVLAEVVIGLAVDYHDVERAIELLGAQTFQEPAKRRPFIADSDQD